MNNLAPILVIGAFYSQKELKPIEKTIHIKQS